ADPMIRASWRNRHSRLSARVEADPHHANRFFKSALKCLAHGSGVLPRALLSKGYARLKQWAHINKNFSFQILDNDAVQQWPCAESRWGDDTRNASLGSVGFFLQQRRKNKKGLNFGPRAFLPRKAEMLGRQARRNAPLPRPLDEPLLD